MGKHYSNPQCFKEKNYEAKFSISLIWKKIKSTKTILEKKNKINHKKKIMWENIVVIHNVIKKKTTKPNSQPVQY